MAWYDIILSPISAIAEVIKEPIKQWGERKAIKVQAEMDVKRIEAESLVAKAKTQLALAENGQKIEADWDSHAQEQMRFSWKDEFLTAVLIFPIVLMFISALIGSDELLDRTIKAVKALDQFPYWYIILIFGIIASTFGLRWLIAPLVAKKMNGKKLDIIDPM